MSENYLPNEMMVQFASMMKAAMPTVKTNKNGYEVRTKILEMAQTQAWQNYNSQLGQFKTSISKDGDEIVTRVEMPVIPGTQDVLETAKKFYEFVNNTGGN